MSVYSKKLRSPAYQTKLVHEFFEDKYPASTIERKLNARVEASGDRECVLELAKEFSSLNEVTTDTLENWYRTTENYIFDLMPWNGAGMFQRKIADAGSLFRVRGVKEIIDFGAGLGTSSIMFMEEYGIEKVHYVDLVPGKTSDFAIWLFTKKFPHLDITVHDSNEFLAGSVMCDGMFAGDVFEHILDLRGLIHKLLPHCNTLIHDSTFYVDDRQPQHIQTIAHEEFAKYCSEVGFERIGFNVYWRDPHAN